MGTTVRLTKEMIEMSLTCKGGYRKARLAAFGISWPPTKGWKKRLIGTEIDESLYKELIHQFKAPVKKKKKRKTTNTTDRFLRSYAWRKLRYQALLSSKGKCECCGRSPNDGIILNVDHIKPRKTHPQLALSLENLQVLCNECNHGKGNWDRTNWSVNTE